MSVYDPNRYTGLLQSGMDRIGAIGEAGYKHYQQEKALDTELPTDVQEYIQRLLKGEDPKALAAEARNNPNVMQYLQGGLPSQPAAQGMVNSVGIQNGKPAIMPPGAFGPASTQNPAPPALQPGQSMQPVRSLSDVNSQHHNAAVGAALREPPFVSGAVGPQAPQAAPRPNMISMGQSAIGGDRGLGQVAENALAAGGGSAGPRQPLQPSIREPLQTAPVDPRTQMDRATLARNPQPAPQPVAPEPQPQAAAKPPDRSGVRTLRQLNMIRDLLPTMEASRGRQLTASINADAKVRAVTENANAKMLVARMAQEGKSEIEIAKRLVDIAKINGQKEIEALKAWVDMEVAGIQAGATLGAARTRAQGSGDDILDQAVKRIRSLEALIGKYPSGDMTLIIPELNMPLWQAQQDLRRWEALASERAGLAGRTYPGPANPNPGTPERAPRPPGGNTAPPPKPPAPAPAPAQQPAPAPPQQTTGSTTAKIKIRYKAAFNGRPAGTVGLIDPAKFNPQIHEQI